VAIKKGNDNTIIRGNETILWEKSIKIGEQQRQRNAPFPKLPQNRTLTSEGKRERGQLISRGGKKQEKRNSAVHSAIAGVSFLVKTHGRRHAWNWGTEFR